MRNPRAIRGWLWRLNAVLALGVAAVGLKLALGPVAASPAPPDIPPRRACSPAEADGPFLLEEALRYLTRLHGPEPAESLGHSPPSPPVTPLPLGAYRALLWVRDPDGPDHVTLRSKDPARPESHLLVEGEVREGLLLAKIEEDGDVVRFHVHRATEEHAYELRPWTGSTRGPIRELPVRAVSPGDGAECLASLRAVPFQGPDGRGLRVTGVRRESAFAAAGLRRGDVIVAAEDAPIATLDDLRRILRDGRGAATLSLRGLDGSDVRHICLASP